MATRVERVAVLVTYKVTKAGVAETGKLEFIARIADASKGYDLGTRSRRAIARRLKVPIASVEITGVMGY